mgnify:CR=1 FL=1
MTKLAGSVVRFAPLSQRPHNSDAYRRKRVAPGRDLQIFEFFTRFAIVVNVLVKVTFRLRHNATYHRITGHINRGTGHIQQAVNTNDEANTLNR